jgi:hypothetical protein
VLKSYFFLVNSNIFRTFASRKQKVKQLNRFIRIMAKTTTTNRSLSEIAKEIKKDWGAKIYFGAKPYLNAMLSLDSVDDNYGWDSGKSMVLYFLSNASTWRGETAKRIKAELKAMVK